MALPLYLARTAAEMGGNRSPAVPGAYMACHFSPWGPGLSNLPEALPPESILILDDSTPMSGHTPEVILRQLSEQMERHQCQSLLLDFQRQGIEVQQDLAALLAEALPFPTAVSEIYAAGLSCPVFLSPVPPERPLSEHLRPWHPREIWLDVTLDALELVLTENGCSCAPLFSFPDAGQTDVRLHCHYDIQLEEAAHFRIWRTREDLEGLLLEAESLGVSRAIGLWQELGR